MIKTIIHLFHKISKCSLGVLLFLCSGFVEAEDSLKTPDLLHNNIVYKKNLINDFLFFTQDPLPFCYSVTSNILMDHKFCELNPNLCNKRSSFLETSVLGVKRSNTDPKLNMNGGSYDRVIDVVKKRGYLISNDSCNYNHITDNLSWITNPAFKQKVDKLKSHYDKYHKYVGYSKYYSEYSKNQFQYMLTEIKIDEFHALDILNEKSFDLVLERIVFDPNCKKPEKYSIPKNFKMKHWEAKEGALKIMQENTKDKIMSLLKGNNLVAVSFCLKEKVTSNDESDNCTTRHSLVISGFAELINKSDESKSKKIAYYVVNSWGEAWQLKTGGLIWADNLHEYMYTTISWLE